MRNFFSALGVLLCLAPHSQAAITLSVADQNVAAGTPSLIVPVLISGPDAMASMTMAIGLNDGGVAGGGTETALMSSFSIDQSIWDTNPAIGSVTSPLLASITTNPVFPTGASVMNFNMTPSSTLVPNGTLAFITVNLTTKNAGDTIVVNPDFFGLTKFVDSQAGTITKAISPGTIRIVAVPEPSGLAIVSCLLSGFVISRRRRK